MQGQSTPVLVLNATTKRETGRKAQLTNIIACKAVADIIKTTLGFLLKILIQFMSGPSSMLKMLLDPMGGIVLSNDGHAILREIDIKHPAGKSMIEISRAQDEEVGDGTTSVIILAGELMIEARPFIERNLHPSIIVKSFYEALTSAIKILKEMAIPLDISSDEQMKNALSACIGTKFVNRWNELVLNLALNSMRVVKRGCSINKLSLDTKRYVKVEKIPGGALEDSQVLSGVLLNKDITHPQMRRQIQNPRIMLLDCTLEYKKGESATEVELTKEEDMADTLQQEMTEIMIMCNHILKFKPDIVVTEKGVSDLAQHFLMKENVSVIRRIRKTDNNRLARVCGATIINRPEELQESDIGTKCKDFHISKIGDEYYAYFVECSDPAACTVLLRGASKDVLNEIERNLQDALAVARNLIISPLIVPGGGAIDMELSQRLHEKAREIQGQIQLPFKAVANALEVIPRTLAQNCGADVVRIITELRAKHAKAKDGLYFGIDGIAGKIRDMKELNIWDPLLVKEQTIKAAIEASCLLLRIDDVVSGFKKKKEQKAGGVNLEKQRQVQQENTEATNENETVLIFDQKQLFYQQFGDQRDG